MSALLLLDMTRKKETEWNWHSQRGPVFPTTGRSSTDQTLLTYWSELEEYKPPILILVRKTLAYDWYAIWNTLERKSGAGTLSMHRLLDSTILLRICFR